MATVSCSTVYVARCFSIGLWDTYNRVCMYIYIYTYMYVYIFLNICMYVYIYIYTTGPDLN